MYRQINKRLLALIIIIIIIIIVGITIYSIQSSKPNVQPVGNNSTNPAIANNSPNGTSTPPTVNIQNMAFNPNNLTVKSGTNVQWINNDNRQHQVMSDTGAFQSNVLNPGDSYNFYFAKAGIYGYHDPLNPTITGTITVQ